MDLKDRYNNLRLHSSQSREFAKECLKEAVVKLSAEMDYDDITVTTLCRRAGVSRMAFYRNYSVIGDIITEIADELNEDVINTIGSPFRTTTTREWYVMVFRLIVERKEKMSLMLEERFLYKWMQVLSGFALHDDSFSDEKKYQRAIWCGGFENAVSLWLGGGMRESVDEMADYCINYLPHFVKAEA